MYNGSGMAVAGAGAKGARPYHYAGGIAVFFFLLSVAGLVFLPIGSGKAKTNALYNPATDFTAIVPRPSDGYGCRVTKVNHVADQRQNKDPYCVDVYVYTFSYFNGTAGGSPTLYNSSAEEHKRSGPGKCTNANSNQVPSTHAVGSTPTCYAPAVRPVSTTLFDFYGCGTQLHCTALHCTALQRFLKLDGSGSESFAFAGGQITAGESFSPPDQCGLTHTHTHTHTHSLSHSVEC